jgi:hypothetical protein
MMLQVVPLLLNIFYNDCKSIPGLPDGFDEWLSFVQVARGFVYWTSGCKTLHRQNFEMHRRLQLRFLHWPLFRREDRLKKALRLVKAGDWVSIETLDWQSFEAPVIKAARHALTFEDDEDEGEVVVVKKSRITYLKLV